MPYFLGNKLLPEYNEKYIYYDPDIKSDFLHIVGAGIVYPDKNYGYKKIRDCHIFEYIVSGEGHLEVSNKKYTVRTGDCVIGKQNAWVKYYSDKHAPYIKLWFSATGKFLDSLFDAFGFTSSAVIATVDLQPQFEQFLSELESGKGSTEELSHLILEILYAVNNNKTEGKKQRLSDLKHIKSYIDTYIGSDITLEAIAGHFNTSVKKIIEVFKIEMGTTPHKYIRAERLNAAKRLLEGSNKSINEIAAALNFCEQSYFSSEFKREFGLYPTEYRKRFRAEKKDTLTTKDFGIGLNESEKSR